jgi:hypothetical protein
MPRPTAAVLNEAARIKEIARRDVADAQAALDAFLDRVKRLDDEEIPAALTFNAQLVTELRRRGCRVCNWSGSDFQLPL